MLAKLLKSAGIALFVISLLVMLIIVSTGVGHAVGIITSSLVAAIFAGLLTALFCTITTQAYFTTT